MTGDVFHSTPYWVSLTWHKLEEIATTVTWVESNKNPPELKRPTPKERAAARRKRRRKK